MEVMSDGVKLKSGGRKRARRDRAGFVNLGMNFLAEVVLGWLIRHVRTGVGWCYPSDLSPGQAWSEARVLLRPFPSGMMTRSYSA